MVVPFFLYFIEYEILKGNDFFWYLIYFFLILLEFLKENDEFRKSNYI